LPARVLAAVTRHVARGDRLVVGLSGGIDSVVLLDLLYRVSKRGGFELAAVHINHQINPAAGEWARFCRSLCKRLGIALKVRRVEVRLGNSLEASARNARYGVFSTLKCAAVALAHNLDDQAETLLLQLLRGTGINGVSAMPEYREGAGVMRSGVVGTARRPRAAGGGAPAVLRPLLDVPRSEIAAYAHRRKLEWIEDYSNDDVLFDRNFLRHRVLPVISERYPAYRQVLARASRNFAEAAELSNDCAVADIAGAGSTLDLGQLRALPRYRIKNVLRYFLRQQGGLMPNARRLEECVRQIVESGAESRLAIALDGGVLRRHGNALHFVSDAGLPATVGQAVWRGEKVWLLPEFGGTLLMRRLRGGGISLAKLGDAELVAQARRGGERLQPDSTRPRRTLKNLWQEAGIPEWQRDRTPLLFAKGGLICVAGIGIDTAYHAVRGEPGVVPVWRPDPA